MAKRETAAQRKEREAREQEDAQAVLAEAQETTVAPPGTAANPEPEIPQGSVAAPPPILNPSGAPAVPSPTSTGNLVTDLLAAFAAASPEEQAALQKMFPSIQQAPRELTLDEELGLLITKRDHRQNNVSAQMIVMTMGSVTHPPDWEPDPPEHVTELDHGDPGQPHRKRWLIGWYNGRAGQSMERFRREIGHIKMNEEGASAIDLGNQTLERLDVVNSSGKTALEGGDLTTVVKESDQSYLSMDEGPLTGEASSEELADLAAQQGNLGNVVVDV